MIQCGWRVARHLEEGWRARQGLVITDLESQPEECTLHPGGAGGGRGAVIREFEYGIKSSDLRFRTLWVQCGGHFRKFRLETCRPVRSLVQLVRDDESHRIL